MIHIQSVGVLHPIIPNLLALVNHAPKKDVQIKTPVTFIQEHFAK